MQNTDKFYINGEWVEPSTSDTLEVINPATEEAIASIAMGGKEDVDKAVAAAKAAFESFSQTSVEERSALLGKIIECYKARMGDIAAAVSQEMGAPIGLKPRGGCRVGKRAGHIVAPGGDSRGAAREGLPLERAGDRRGALRGIRRATIVRDGRRQSHPATGARG